MHEDWHYALDEDEVEEEDVMPAVICDQRIAVYRISGRIYATEDRCTHGGAALSEGVVVGDVIECPLHQGRFCIRTGQPRGGPVRQALRTFPTKVENGRISIRITGSGAEE